MSLRFAAVDGKPGAVGGTADNFLTINNKNEDIIVKYNALFDIYKSMILPGPDGSDENGLSLSDVKFLENVMKIKTKIKELHKEHTIIVDKIVETNGEIDELDKIRKSCIETNEILARYMVPYNFLKQEKLEKPERDIAVNDTTDVKTDDEKLKIIFDILCDKRKTLEEYQDKGLQILEEIKLLKTIICTNDVTSTTPNSEFTKCSICADKAIECCLNPCGHTFCNNCAVLVAKKTCYFCRKAVTSTTKLFFDNLTN
jgi:hypothetical protein